MARKKPHEDHVNHEAWAIPYGDMLVLLLALFVVMYAVSSVNEGKYRVLADSLNAEFSGAPRSISPIQFGSKQTGSEADSRSSTVRLRAAQTMGGPAAKTEDAFQAIQARLPMPLHPSRSPNAGRQGGAAGSAANPPPGMAQAPTARSQAAALAERRSLEAMGTAIKGALGDLVKRDLVRVRASSQMLEVEIRADILYPSASAQLVPSAVPILAKLADILAKFPNAIRVEGHTDALPISSSVYPSNWELSAARAASVVHLFSGHGVRLPRMSITGFAEFRPLADNSSVAGRNRNRRVVVVVLSREGEALPIDESGAPVAASRPRTSAAAATSDVAATPDSAEPSTSTEKMDAAKRAARRPSNMIALPEMRPQVSLSRAPPAAAPAAAATSH